jgi:uncharacterized protein YjbI with pentapeptide repeats
VARRTIAPSPASLAPVRLTGLVGGEAAELRAGVMLDGRRFEATDLADRDLTGIGLLECELIDVRAGGAALRGASIAHAVIRTMDAATLGAARSRWREVEIHGSRVGSFDASEASWQSVLLRGCRLGYVNLRGATLENVIFEDCTIDELDLGAATVARASFTATRIVSLDLSGARLSTVDLRGAELQRITSLPGLAGTTMDDHQIQALAGSFARHFGISIGPERD